MKIFKITKDIEVVCESEKTRNGFRHLATLMRNGNEEASGKCCYLNRTWEKYEFQSVLHKVVENDKCLSEEERKICKDFIEGDHTDWSDFKMVNQIAKLGEIFCDNQKDKNDWKVRMLKAGLGNKGLEMPEDWDSLDEDTKTARLDGIMKIMNEVSK